MQLFVTETDFQVIAAINEVTGWKRHRRFHQKYSIALMRWLFSGKRMTKNTLKMALSAIALGLMASTASFAVDAPIYGSQLMTNQERIEHRNKLRATKTAEEREQVRLQHHGQMQLRAKEQGVTLPDTPPTQGGGQGRGMGGMSSGGGTGPGGGMGSGRNR